MTHTNNGKQPGGHRAVSGGNGRSQPKAIIPRPEQLSSPDYLFDQEEFVLGYSMMCSKEERKELAKAFDPDDLSPHAFAIWNAIQSFNGDAVDYIAVSTVLEDRGQLKEVGGEDYLAKLYTDAVTCEHWDRYGLALTYAKQIRDLGERHKLMDRVEGAVSFAMDGDMKTARLMLADNRQGLPESWQPLPEEARLPEGLGDDACPWLNEYIAFSKKWSPRSYDGYHEAVGLWVLSTVAARRVAFQFGGLKYTSLYSMLIGRTTLHYKSTAANVGRDVLRAAGLHHLLAPDESTPQALVRSLAGKTLPDSPDGLTTEALEWVKNRHAFTGQKGWFAEEMGSFLAAMMRADGVMADFRGLLRQLHDNPPEYTRETVGRGVETIKRPYLSLMGNLTLSDLKPIAQKNAQIWGDGFLARFAFYVPPESEFKTDEFPRGEMMIPAYLVDHLKKWNDTLGVPAVSFIPLTDEDGESNGKYVVDVPEVPPKVVEVTDEVWAASYRYGNAVMELAAMSDLTCLDGNYGRLQERGLRIAALLASASGSKRIELKHWARAQEILEQQRLSTHRLIEQISKTEKTQEETMEDKVLMLLAKKRKAMTAREVSQAIWGLDSRGATLILESLAKAGAVVRIETGRTVRFATKGVEV